MSRTARETSSGLSHPRQEGIEMTISVLMPALSPTMEEGTLAKWLVREGDTVSSGDIIAEIETDKATMEVEAVDEGVVGRLAVAEGTEGVKVNTVIAVLLEEGESAADIGEIAAGPAAAPAAQAASAPAPATNARTGTRGTPGGRTGSDGGPRSGRHRSGLARGHAAGQPDRARGPARCDGRGDAPRRRRLPDGRGGGRVPGRLQDQPGPAGRVRRAPRHRHPDHRARFCRHRRRRGLCRAEADRRVHDLQLRHAGD